MPSRINELMLAELTAALEKASALILVDASKLNSEEAIKLRAGLRKVGAKLKVGKSALVYRVLPAGTNTIVAAKGPIGVIATGGDIAAAAKLLNELIKEEKVALKGAVLEGRAMDAKSAAKLADLPTREQTNVMLVRVLQGPLTQLVRIVNSKPTELVRVLKVKSDEQPA